MAGPVSPSSRAQPPAPGRDSRGGAPARPSRKSNLRSRTFLAWNGTVLMCLRGHTLLHVPALPTSWFYAPRWDYLDPSWEFLFCGMTRVRSDQIPKCLSAVSGAPRDATVRSCMLFDGALLIQRLEGSRPHGSLCTLHRSERVQVDQEQTELGRMRLPEGRMERASGSPRADADAGETDIRGVLAGRAKESACAPKRGQRPRMWIEIHAAHRSGWGGERSRSWAAESRSTTRMVPPQTGQFQSEWV